MPNPAFIWPADHAWCVADDVDPHWAGIGADVSVVEELLADPPLDVVAADPRQDQPAFRWTTRGPLRTEIKKSPRPSQTTGIGMSPKATLEASSAKGEVAHSVPREGFPVQRANGLVQCAADH
jgi:hypothetical protein